ncbi:MAG: anthranilate synthase component I family protein [Thermoproteota archaeon]
MREILKRNSLIGYISYSFASIIEKLPYKPFHPFHDLEMIVTDKKLNFKTLRFNDLVNSIRKLVSSNEFNSFKVNRALENKNKEEFERDVYKVKKYILKGEAFQVVISRRYEINFDGSLIEPFLNLVLINPSPYMYYLKFGDRRIIGASPETLFRIKNGILETFPIAGTRHRSNKVEEDLRLLKELQNSLKDYAEHSMLVDLARNDVGKVSEIGTVKVSYYRKIKKYSHVQHIVSKVTGKLRKGLDSIDALEALFPAGTVSGAPKIRAMELIDSIEKYPRGPYAGVVGIINQNQLTDLAITIRSIFSYNNTAYIQAGAGIVFDSDPTSEYYETEYKMKAAFEAMNIRKEVVLT